MKAGIGRMLLHSARCSLPISQEARDGGKQHPSFFRFHLWASAHSYTYSAGVTAGVTLLALHLYLLLVLCFPKACWASLLWGAATANLDPAGPGTLSGNPGVGWVGIGRPFVSAQEITAWVWRRHRGCCCHKANKPRTFYRADDFTVSTPELVLKPLVLQQQLLSRAISPALARPVNGAGRHLFWHDKEAEKFVGVQ